MERYEICLCSCQRFNSSVRLFSLAHLCIHLALGSQPLLELWKRNAVTSPEEYHSSEPEESGEGSPDLPRSSRGESIEVSTRYRQSC